MIAGVCGGWAHAHGWEPVRVRGLAGLVVAVVAVPPLVLVPFASYVFAWLTWTLEPEAAATPRAMV